MCPAVPGELLAKSVCCCRPCWDHPTYRWGRASWGVRGPAVPTPAPAPLSFPGTTGAPGQIQIVRVDPPTPRARRTGADGQSQARCSGNTQLSRVVCRPGQIRPALSRAVSTECWKQRCARRRCRRQQGHTATRWWQCGSAQWWWRCPQCCWCFLTPLAGKLCACQTPVACRSFMPHVQQATPCSFTALP